jgi:phosphoribosylformimino-5-aminoimidazole carboxamide ribotide isomerase
MRFRPCIDLHDGAVKQIVGATLSAQPGSLHTNFTADLPSSHYADLYRRDGLDGGHVIMLGPGNEAAASGALAAFPGGLQIGGGMTPDNAPGWLDRGAAGIIVTSYIFDHGRLQPERLERMAKVVGRERLIFDLSCARVEGCYVVAVDRWQTLTDFEVSAANLAYLASRCAEFLVHATQKEGRQEGIDADLVKLLADASPIPTTYAGGIRNMSDIDAIGKHGQGRIDFTVGSALDIFGGEGIRYEELASSFGRGANTQ